MSEFEYGKFGKAIKSLEAVNTPYPSHEERRKAWKEGRTAEVTKGKGFSKKRAAAMGGFMAVLGTSLLLSASSGKERTPVTENPACATSPKAELGDTKWSLAREVYPNLDALSQEVVTVESSSTDGILRPNDTVTVCVPLESVKTVNKPAN